MARSSGTPRGRLEPFRIAVPDEALVDLRRRLERTRWPAGTLGETWEYGTRAAELGRLVDYWRDTFDWRALETRLNAYPQFRASVTGVSIHFVLVEGSGPDPLPLILSHGWPSSFIELLPLVARLTDPASFGGDPADAFTVVAPSVPGFGFSDPVYDPDTFVADLWHELMTGVLGFERFGAQGGDIGARITADLARLHPGSLVGIHLQSDWDDQDLAGFGDDPEERAFLDRERAWVEAENGYGQIQGTKPQTLGYALSDSPIGLAAWILEKFHAWGDAGDDVVATFGEDELLTNITFYWLTNTITTSFLRYWNVRHRSREVPHQRIGVPTAIARFPADEPLPPGRSAAERLFDLRRFTDMPRGGHFPGFEAPDLLAADIVAFFAGLRRGPTHGAGWHSAAPGSVQES